MRSGGASLLAKRTSKSCNPCASSPTALKTGSKSDGSAKSAESGSPTTASLVASQGASLNRQARPAVFIYKHMYRPCEQQRRSCRGAEATAAVSLLRHDASFSPPGLPPGACLQGTSGGPTAALSDGAPDASFVEVVHASDPLDPE